MVPNNDFDFPKSLWNVYECLYATTKENPNALILDFFAGSGTTAHAVELLNKLCGGNRKYILITNNAIGEKKDKEFQKMFGDPKDYPEQYLKYEQQFGVCSSITYPRLCAVANGYTAKKDIKEVLYEKKFNNQFFNKYPEEKEKILSITKNNKSKYDLIKNVYEDNSIKVVGIKKKNNKIEGIHHNLKYFVCEKTPRKPEEYLLSNILLLHIKEMIELDYAIEIDNKKYVLILNKNDFKKYILNPSIYEKIEKIWVNQNIIFDNNELKLINKKDIKYIPYEYFGKELKEVGE